MAPKSSTYRTSTTPITMFAHLIFIAVLILVLVWLIHVREGLSFTSDNKPKLFNLHPLFMVIGFILISGEAIMAYKSIPAERRRHKAIHMTLNFIAISAAIVGLYAVFQFHHDLGIAHMYTLHSWFGITVVSLFALQNSKTRELSEQGSPSLSTTHIESLFSFFSDRPCPKQKSSNHRSPSVLHKPNSLMQIMHDHNTSMSVFKVDDAHPSSAPFLSHIVDIKLSTPTQSISAGSIASNSDSNDLSISFLYFEEAKMADTCKWEDNSTMTFIYIMLENQAELTSSTFKPSMWNKFSEELLARTGLKFTTAQLSTKFQRLRLDWRKYNWLMKQTGLGIDPQSGAIIATDEQWQQLDIMQEGVQKFRRGGLPYYDELTQLFNKSSATGGCARSASVAAPNSDEERNLQQNLVGDTIFANSSAYGQFRDSVPSISSEPSKSSGKRKMSVISPESGDGPSKKSKGSSTVEMLTQLWTAKEMKKEGKKQAVYEDNDPYSMPRCVEILNQMHLEPHVFCHAIHLLQDRTMRQAFVTMIPEMRYVFLSNI